MRKAMYKDRFIWLTAIIFGYFCYPIIKDITLTLIQGVAKWINQEWVWKHFYKIG